MRGEGSLSEIAITVGVGCASAPPQVLDRLDWQAGEPAEGNRTADV
jgi:hypothetical protein